MVALAVLDFGLLALGLGGAMLAKTLKYKAKQSTDDNYLEIENWVVYGLALFLVIGAAVSYNTGHLTISMIALSAFMMCVGVIVGFALAPTLNARGDSSPTIVYVLSFVASVVLFVMSRFTGTSKPSETSETSETKHTFTEAEYTLCKQKNWGEERDRMPPSLDEDNRQFLEALCLDNIPLNDRFNTVVENRNIPLLKTMLKQQFPEKTQYDEKVKILLRNWFDDKKRTDLALGLDQLFSKKDAIEKELSRERID